MWKLLADSEIADRVRRLELPFNRYGYDHFGVSQRHLAAFFTLLSKFYRNYFSITAEGVEHVPERGRAMLVGNHSGGVAFDGGMVVASMFLDKEPPRLVQGMVEKFLNDVPFTAPWMYRAGQFTGLPENAIRLLENDRLLLVFPEGARGTAKLHREQNSLVRFGTGFMRLALQTGSPIVPFAFSGGGDIFPTVANLYTLGKLVGAPYIPITKYLLPIPLPLPCEIYYGEPMYFEGDGKEDDEVIESYVAQVRARINDLVTKGCQNRQMDEAAMRATGWRSTEEILEEEVQASHQARRDMLGYQATTTDNASKSEEYDADTDEAIEAQPIEPPLENTEQQETSH